MLGKMKDRLAGATMGRLVAWAGTASCTAMAAALAPAHVLAQAVTDMPGGPKVNQFNLHDPVTSIARGQHMVHEILLWVSIVICILVFGAMFYSIIVHRKSRGVKPATFHESTAVEIAWTVVPMIIVIGLAVVATEEVIAQKDTSNAHLTVKATGYQWKWGYEYLAGEGEGIQFLSTLSTPQSQITGNEPKSLTYLMEVDNALVVPVNKKVRVVITANDVIHSWMVPAFGVKQDAIPGFVRDTWFRAEKVGTYRGQCAELCGKDHAFMPIVVEVKSEADYAAWVDQTRKEMLARADDPNKVWEAGPLAERGARVYAANCVACHQANGMGTPGAFPALAGSATVLGPLDHQIDILLNGVVKNGTPTAMASFKQLSDTEIAAVITYTRNTWGNKPAQNLVQPSDIAGARTGKKVGGAAGTSSAAPAAVVPVVAAAATAPAPAAAAPAATAPAAVASAPAAAAAAPAAVAAAAGNAAAAVGNAADKAAAAVGNAVETARQAAASATATATAAVTAAAGNPGSAPAANALPVSVLFAIGSSDFDAAATRRLDEAATLLKAAPDMNVALFGFVDSSGSAAQNEELARNRAEAVRAALVKAGVAEGRIELRKPSVIEAGSVDDALARRVDIVAR